MAGIHFSKLETFYTIKIFGKAILMGSTFNELLEFDKSSTNSESYSLAVAKLSSCFPVHVGPTERHASVIYELHSNVMV